MRGGWLAALLLVAPLAFVATAGCVCGPSGPPVTARGIASGPSTAGVGGFALDVLVTDGPGGPPLPGAGVVVYWAQATTSGWSGPVVRVSGEGGNVDVAPPNATATVAASSVDRLLTDAGGHATAHVGTGHIVGVVAAKDEYTEEWIPAVAAGGSGASGTVTLPLYRARIVADLDEVWPAPGGASSGAVTGNHYLWDAHAAPFGNGSDAQRGYAARIVELSVTVNWTNGATGSGDLAVGAGPPGSDPAFFHDGGANAALGAQSEAATMGLSQLASTRTLGAPTVMVGAASQTGVAAPFGLPYRLHVDALFDTARATEGGCGASASDGGGVGAKVPAPGAGLFVAVVAGLAVLARRRG